MRTATIKISFSAGTSVEEAFEEALRLANFLDVLG